MQPDAPQTPFEVICSTCRVTFPVGTRSCIHCGQRIGRSRYQTETPLRPQLDEVAEDEASTSRIRILSPRTLLWLVLIIGAGLNRAC